MKRSEMVDKIDDYLISKGFHKAGSFDQALDILELIENLGMLPPELDNGNVHIKFNEWERE